MQHLVISFISPDRLGLVDTMSNIVKQNKGNWRGSSLHHMSGFFAGVIEVAIDESHSEQLISAFKKIDKLESTIKIANEAIEHKKPNIILDLTANDRGGIVQEISSVIHQQGGNLIKMVSKQAIAPHSGQELFKAKVTVSMNDNDIDKLIEAIERLADDLIVDVTR